VKAKLESCQEELSLTRAELIALKETKSTSKTFENGAESNTSSRANMATFPSVDKQYTATLSVPVLAGSHRSRSTSVKRRRLLNDTDGNRTGFSSVPVTIGTGESSDIAVPVVKKIIKKRYSYLVLHLVSLLKLCMRQSNPG